MGASAAVVVGVSNSFSPFAERTMLAKYALKDSHGNPTEHWPDISRRVVGAVGASWLSKEENRELVELVSSRKFLPGGRYLYSAGRPYHQVNNCFLYRAEDSREAWSDLLRKVSASLMSGGGVGIDYSLVRAQGSPIRKTGGMASGPISLMQMVNEVGRHVMQGGSRRSAIWAGLHWRHGDIFQFIHIKDWSPSIRALKAEDFNFPGSLDMTNISVILDKDFFDAFEDEKHSLHSLAVSVYNETFEQMRKTSEPGFSINYDDPSESLRNACTEITSSDDSDVCNLGSINLARVSGPAEFSQIVELATKFLVCGTLYSDIPHEEVRATREKNRRLGLGLMGLHEFLLMRGAKYGDTDNEDLNEILEIYKTETTRVANRYSDSLGISRPIKTRAIAPTGTIGIVAETTTGIEPIFCAAYKRRYLRGGKNWSYEYVVDPTAKKLIDLGSPASSIEDAGTLAESVEGLDRRISFQRHVQKFVDHSISSTCNIPGYGTGINDDARAGQISGALYKNLRGLRGITFYADGSRGGQPLSRVAVEDALAHVGQVFTESVDVCDITGGGTCSS